MVTLGTGNYTYEVVENWAKLPDGWGFKEVAAVGVDANDNVYAFNRGAHPMMVFDRHGNFLLGGRPLPTRPWHHREPDGTLFCTDDGDHTVRKCTLDGKVLFTLGMSGKPAPVRVNRLTGAPTWPSTPQRDSYVSDGYCNARVHKYRPMANCSLPGVSQGRIQASSTLSIISPPTRLAGSTSPTGRITASRCLTQRQV